MNKLLYGLQFDKGRAVPEILGLKRHTICVATLQDLMVATRQHVRNTSKILGINPATLRSALNSGKPTVIYIEEFEGLFKYTLLK